MSRLSYRSISLLNIDLKILVKHWQLISTELSSLLAIINQTGLTPASLWFFNTRRLLDNYLHFLLKHSWSFPHSWCRKAFDRLKWRGDICFSFKRNVSSPRASVVTINIPLTTFYFWRGTRQGCPLSPLSFYYGYFIFGQTHKL